MNYFCVVIFCVRFEGQYTNSKKIGAKNSLYNLELYREFFNQNLVVPAECMKKTVFQLFLHGIRNISPEALIVHIF